MTFDGTLTPWSYWRGRRSRWSCRSSPIPWSTPHLVNLGITAFRLCIPTEKVPAIRIPKQAIAWLVVDQKTPADDLRAVVRDYLDARPAASWRTFANDVGSRGRAQDQFRSRAAISRTCPTTCTIDHVRLDSVDESHDVVRRLFAQARRGCRRTRAHAPARPRLRRERSDRTSPPADPDRLQQIEHRPWIGRR